MGPSFSNLLSEVKEFRHVFTSFGAGQEDWGEGQEVEIFFQAV